MKPILLKLSDPRVMAAVADFTTMQRWEVLRRSERAMSAQEFARACSTTLEKADVSLDLLLDAGFVTRTRGSARSRQTTYAVAAERILVEFDRTDAAQRGWIDSQRREVRGYVRNAVDSFRQSESPAPKTQYLEFYRSSVLTQADVSRIAAVMARALESVLQIEHEARERLAAAPGAGPVATQTLDGLDEAETNCPAEYMTAIQVMPAGPGVLPLPNITLIDSVMAQRRMNEMASTPTAMLTARELEIAERLAAGESRPEAARSLGISVNTVATMSKRIYAKLGVASRAELAARMSSPANG